MIRLYRAYMRKLRIWLIRKLADGKPLMVNVVYKGDAYDLLNQLGTGPTVIDCEFHQVPVWRSNMLWEERYQDSEPPPRRHSPTWGKRQ